eukprot:1337085-Amorphochlora_amoeboformis.AAC.2
MDAFLRRGARSEDTVEYRVFLDAIPIQTSNIDDSKTVEDQRYALAISNLLKKALMPGVLTRAQPS